jgi:hypothetical protein
MLPHTLQENPSQFPILDTHSISPGREISQRNHYIKGSLESLLPLPAWGTGNVSFFSSYFSLPYPVTLT